MQIEVNQKFVKAGDEFQSPHGASILITPPLDEEYWIYRVPLKHGQAIVAFPKFGMIGCGFAKEKDWNTNLPLDCKAEEIYAHIKHNKRYRDISDEDCIAAIQALKDYAKEQKS
jgi:hypothetical protein